MIPHLLTIAGSDSSGGAGIQADLKTFSALGAYGMSALTALTAQNTQGVQGVQIVPADFVAQQLRSVFEDIHVDALKIGMAGDPETVGAIAECLKRYKPAHVVLDPVIVAGSGDRLVSEETVEAFKMQLMPLATLVTPNIPEAQALTGQTTDDLDTLAQAVFDLGTGAALVKGGHAQGPTSRDVLVTPDLTHGFDDHRIETDNTHGTGCTLSSAIAVYLAKDVPLVEAVRKAKAYVTEALKNADMLQIGQGSGPVHHFYDLWDRET